MPADLLRCTEAVADLGDAPAVLVIRSRVLFPSPLTKNVERAARQ